MPRPPPAHPSLSAKSGAALPGLRRRRVPWGGVGPAALPRFWRPFGLGPNTLPRRFLRRVAALPLRPPLSGLQGPRCQDTARRGAHPAAQTPRGLRGGTWPAFWPPLAGEEQRGCSWRRAELQGRRRPGREPRAQSRSPRCLRVPGRASRAPSSAQRRRGDTAGRGRGEERAERGRAPSRPGLAGPLLRQSAGADAGGGSTALGYQLAWRGEPGAPPCGRCAPGRPAAPARSRLRPARPLALPFSPQSLQPGLLAAT